MQNDKPKIQLTAVLANLEKDKGFFDKLDPYCIVQCGDQEFRTHTDKCSGKKPVWLEQFHLQCNKENIIKVRVFDEIRFLPDSFVGEGEVSYTQLTHKDKTELWIDLFKHDKLVGKVLLQAELEGFTQGFESTLQTSTAVIRGGLGEVLDKGGFVQSFPQSGSKTAEISTLNSNSFNSTPGLENFDPSTATLVESLNEAGFTEAPLPAGSKIGGLNNTGGGSIKAFDEQRPSFKNGSESPQNHFKSQGFGQLLDKCGFQEAPVQEGSKLAGTQNLPCENNKSQDFKNTDQTSQTISLSETLDKSGFSEALEASTKLAGINNTNGGYVAI